MICILFPVENHRIGWVDSHRHFEISFLIIGSISVAMSKYHFAFNKKIFNKEKLLEYVQLFVLITASLRRFGYENAKEIFKFKESEDSSGNELVP